MSSQNLEASCAAAGLHQSGHDGLAAFLAGTASEPKQAADAAIEAARLPGLSLRAEMRLLLAAGQFRQALACLAALAARATELAPVLALPAFRAATQTAGIPAGFPTPSSTPGAQPFHQMPHELLGVSLLN
jgi:hypothetical protein